MISYGKYAYEEHEHLYGPGKRLVFWTQGCSLHCKGCINPHLWNFSRNKLISPEELASLVNLPDIEGITLLGGEPLDQSMEMLRALDLIKKTGKTIILFTGYLKRELFMKSQKKIWKIADIVIAGRFVLARKNIFMQFRGSTNQRVTMHKGPYENYKVKDGKTLVIFEVDDSGFIDMKGFETHEVRKSMNL